METTILVIAGVIIAALVALCVFAFTRKPQASAPMDLAGLSTALQNLTQAAQQANAQTAALSEKVTQIESVVPSVNAVHLELKSLAERTSHVETSQGQIGQGLQELGRGLTESLTLSKQLTETTKAIQAELSRTKTDVTALSERVSKVDGNQTQFGHGMSALGSQLAQADVVGKSLVQATAALRNELAHAKNDLTQIGAQAKARHDMEQKTASSIARLEAVIAGTQSKGAAGENILDAIFSRLPIEWQMRNFQVNGKPCEFGLRLPNSLILPIDSKWAATQLLEDFIACDEVGEQQRLKAQIQSVVLIKAKEVKKYIDPSQTPNFGVAVVPDAVYELCSQCLSEAFQHNVVLVSHSMFMPYLMLVFQTIHKSSQNIDMAKLDRHIEASLQAVAALQKEFDGRNATALTMINNSRTEMNVQLGKVRGNLSALHSGEIVPPPDATSPLAELAA